MILIMIGMNLSVKIYFNGGVMSWSTWFLLAYAFFSLFFGSLATWIIITDKIKIKRWRYQLPIIMLAWPVMVYQIATKKRRINDTTSSVA